MKIKLAIFDVDGTLFDGNLGIEFLKMLVANKMFPQDISKQIFSWYSKYKSGEVEKSLAVDEIYKLYAKGMKSLSTDKVNEVAVLTWDAVQNKMFRFAIEITKLLQDAGFQIVLLSGSPIEMINHLANILKIESNAAIAGKLEIKDDKYTGDIISYPGSAEQKEQELSKYLMDQSVDVDWINSLAMGDNERDLNVLYKVGLPLVFEPNDALLKIANANGWQVLDRNKVINTLASLVNQTKILS